MRMQVEHDPHVKPHRCAVGIPLDSFPTRIDLIEREPGPRAAPKSSTCDPASSGTECGK